MFWTSIPDDSLHLFLKDEKIQENWSKMLHFPLSPSVTLVCTISYCYSFSKLSFQGMALIQKSHIPLKSDLRMESCSMIRNGNPLLSFFSFFFKLNNVCAKVCGWKLYPCLSSQLPSQQSFVCHVTHSLPHSRY